MDEMTDYNSSFQPHLQWDARAEMALSSYHRGHRFVVRTLGKLPWKAGRGRGFGHNVFGDLTVSGILSARSFAPFNLNAGHDNVGDRHTDTHRPWGLGRNVGIGPNFFSIDMRVKRRVTFAEEKSVDIVVEAFNLLNRTNFKHVNGEVGTMTLEDLPSSYKGRIGPVTQPFSFTSAFPPRQVQISLRLNF